MIELKNYGVCTQDGKPLVSNVNFQISAKGSLGIVGESGSGKSITALGMLSLLSTSKLSFSGTLSFFNKTLTVGTPNWKNALQQTFGQDIGVIFQDPMTALHPTLKIKKQLLESIKKGISKAEKLQKCHDILSKVGLDANTLNKYTFQLSGGQQQRVMIAMALINEPKLIVADEPNTALDFDTSQQICSLIKELQQKMGAALLFISHDIELVAEMAQQIAVMYQGKIVEQNASKTLLNHPQENYTKALLACRPKPSSKGFFLPEIHQFNEHYQPEKIPDIISEKVRLTAEKISPGYEIKKAFHPIVKDFNLEIKEAKTLGLIGQSGSGKSTIAKSLIGWTSNSKGTLLLNGEKQSFPLRNLKKIRGKIQYVFQDPYGSLNPSKTIFQILTQPFIDNKLGSKKDAENAANTLLEEVGLPQASLQKYPHEFSGGQRQRIVIARALILKPEILICDESVSALDLSVQAKILNLLKRIQIKYKIGILFISHDKDVVDYFCDAKIELSATN